MNDYTQNVATGSVRWKTAWGGIFAGAMVTLAVFLLFSTLGTGLAFSVGDQTPATGTAIWVAASALLGLFLGGWVTNQWVSRETKMEAVINGATLWSVVFIAVAWMTINGIQTGFSTVMGLGSLVAGTASFNVDNLADIQNQLGLSDEQLGQLQQQLEQQFGTVFNADQARTAAWWSFFGIIISLACAIGGSLVGMRRNVVVRQGRFPQRTEHAA